MCGSHLDSLIDFFLEDHRECSAGGGYAQITKDDLDQLRTIIRELIELKCDRDADGDLPIQVKIINRRTHEPLHFGAVEYRDLKDADGFICGERPFMETLRVLMMNLGIATSRLDIEFRIAQHRETTLDKQREG